MQNSRHSTKYKNNPHQIDQNAFRVSIASWELGMDGNGKIDFSIPVPEKFLFLVSGFSRSRFFPFREKWTFPFPFFPVPFPISHPSLILLLKSYKELPNFS